MAVCTEFINLIVPIQVIKDKYPGGWEQCLEDHKNKINRSVWFDEHLFHDGTMNPMDMESLVERWGKLGFECIGHRVGNPYWKDVCVVEFGPTMPCDWIAVDRKTRGVYLKGTEPGVLIGRN